jgi:hypothetical protein
MVPPESVIVKLPEIAVPRDTVALNVPVPKLVKVAGPDTVMEVPTDTVAFVTVSVVEVVAAFAMAAANIARVHVLMIAVIYVSSASTSRKIARKCANNAGNFRRTPYKCTSTHLGILKLLTGYLSAQVQGY